MRLALKSFKNHENGVFDLAGNTSIEGENGSGKTSLLEAIMFVLYGRDFYGSLSVEGFIQKGEDNCSVTLEYGPNTYRRVMGRESMVFLNGVRQRHTDYASRLPTLELSYCIINPLYMLDMSTLTLRSLFMQYTPLPDPVGIFKKEYSKREDLIERFSKGTYEEEKALFKEMEASFLALERELELKEAELFSCEAQRQQILSNRVRMPVGVIKRERDRQVEIDKLNRKMEEIKGVEGEYQAVKDRLTVIRREVSSYLEECDVETLSELRDFYKENYETVMEEYRRLEVRSFQLEMATKELDGRDRCPTCGGEVIWEEFQKRNSSEVKITKSLMDKLKPQLDELKERFDLTVDLKSEVLKLTKREEFLKKKLSERANLKKKIDRAREKQIGMKEEDFKNAVESEAQRKMIVSLLDRRRRLKERITSIKKGLKELGASLKDSGVIVEALSPKGVRAHQAASVGKVLEERLVKYFPGKKVEVLTVRRNKSNDNYREVFEVKVDNVFWRELSFGERILIAVVMGLVLRESVGDFPFKFVLLDEASVLSNKTRESIEELLGSGGIDFYYTLAKEGSLKLRSY